MSRKDKVELKEFDEIYIFYYPLVMNILYYKNVNKDDAEDICHEVFVRVMKNLNDIQKDKIFAWIKTSIRQELLTYIKKNQNNHLNIDEILYDKNIEFVNGERDNRILLEKILDDPDTFKDDAERTIFLLRIQYGYQINEICSLVKRERGFVQNKYNSAKKRLLDKLNKLGFKELEDLYEN